MVCCLSFLSAPIDGFTFGRSTALVIWGFSVQKGKSFKRSGVHLIKARATGTYEKYSMMRGLNEVTMCSFKIVLATLRMLSLF
jgi:hypothetical protein